MNTVLENHVKNIQLKTYKGFRLLRGYPIHGQRTRSNHKTSFKKSYKFKFYYL